MKSKFEVHRMEFNNTVYQNGFSMKFENGYTISVQFSEINYSDGKTTAEVAVIDADGEWYQLVDGEDVIGWQSTDDVAKWMDKVSKLKSEYSLNLKQKLNKNEHKNTLLQPN